MMSMMMIKLFMGGVDDATVEKDFLLSLDETDPAAVLTRKSQLRRIYVGTPTLNYFLDEGKSSENPLGMERSKKIFLEKYTKVNE